METSAAGKDSLLPDSLLGLGGYLDFHVQCVPSSFASHQTVKQHGLISVVVYFDHRLTPQVRVLSDINSSETDNSVNCIRIARPYSLLDHVSTCPIEIRDLSSSVWSGFLLFGYILGVCECPFSLQSLKEANSTHLHSSGIVSIRTWAIWFCSPVIMVILIVVNARSLRSLEVMPSFLLTSPLAYGSRVDILQSDVLGEHPL